LTCKALLYGKAQSAGEHGEESKMDLPVSLQTPLDAGKVADLRIGNRVLLSGTIYTARDATHKRLVATLKQGNLLPFELEGQMIYYVGPTPPQTGDADRCSGADDQLPDGPIRSGTDSARFERHDRKGMRDPSVKTAMQRYKAVYMAAIGGAGALIKHN
jgi:fumarate hydratase subunit beta